MKKKDALFYIVLIILIATLVFIFQNSLQPAAESSEKSESVMNSVKPLFEFFLGRGNVTDHIIRKTAHFIEFTVLGAELMLLAVLSINKLRFQNFLNCLFAGLTSAVIDESLQLLTDRGPLVQDILLDFCGVMTGVLIVLLTKPLFIKKRNRYY